MTLNTRKFDIAELLDTDDDIQTRKHYTLAELLEGIKEGDTLNIDETFEHSLSVGNEII